MEPTLLTQLPNFQAPSYQEAWDMVLSQLRMEMARAQFETWVQPLRPVGYQERVFTLSAFNPYARDWVENRLKSRITHLMEGLYNDAVTLQVVVGNAFYREGDARGEQSGQGAPPAATAPADVPTAAATQAPDAAPVEPPLPLTKNRKVMLQRATALAMEDLGIMPIHFQFTMWATKKNVAYVPRTDEYTLAFQFKPVKQ